MSQWNNSYAYQNQHQGSNNWSGDVNGQYSNETSYQGPSYDSGNQYVSFNEFLYQMQGGTTAAPAAANYNLAQYQNYPDNQYNFQNLPSTSQNTHNSYAYTQNPTNSNDVETYQAQSQYKSQLPDQTALNDVVIKSNLTPTATEFVPKASNIRPSSSTQHVKPESSKSRNIVKESKSGHVSSSDTNWRERPQTSERGQHSNSRSDYRQNDRYDNHNYRKESYNQRDSNSRYNESGRNSGHQNYERNYDNQNEHYEAQNYEGNNRNYDNRYERGPKGNKNRNKDFDRTYFNSSMSKNGTDAKRNEVSGRSKNYPGSSRLRGINRNISEDEQYAHNYLQYKDEKQEKNTKEKVPINKDKVSSPKHKSKEKSEHGDIKEMTQRDRLSEQLNKGTLECLVCCDRVRQSDPIWSCSNCYHVLHLRCIRKWATSSMVENKWRCPACQNTSSEIPTESRCLCGAGQAAEWARGGGAGAHCCGGACRRPRACPHVCPLPCHPGPCPPCATMQAKKCGCGAEERSVICSNKAPLTCGRTCGRTLPCGVHTCERTCHEESCGDCTATIVQVCYCSAAVERTVACTAETARTERWSCGAQCTFVLSCGAHSCVAVCHPPPCEPCPLRPEAVTTCPCGNTKLDPTARKSCTEPVPTCDNLCGKPLPCGPAGDRHFCKFHCHQGECPACTDSTLVACRCGHTSREVPCAELASLQGQLTCQRKCTKKLSCGRHRCKSVCCADPAHRCLLVCGRSLPCQLHRCQACCHTGHCAPCPVLSFEELTCECGLQVLYPPIRCGTRPPACPADCPRPRPCGHPPHHACHSGPCPPCVVLTPRACHGKHEERKTIPCSQEEFSCGLPCGKPLPCGKHTCIKLCHKGPCDTEKCSQPCEEKRPSCGHECAAPCHFSNGGPCPSPAPCRRTVRAACPCGRRRAPRACADNARDLHKIMSALAASKAQEGGTVDLSELRPGAMLKTLECDDECRVEARNRQLALALQIRNPDVSAKLTPRYSEHVRATAAREPAFARAVHDQLAALVQRAKESKQKTRSHSFPSMNWAKRQFVHELCEQFGCESVAYDAEPNRNVVATANREKSWLPAMSVLEVLAREAGKRRVPGPVLRPPPASQQPKTTSGWATLTSTNAWASRSQPRAADASAPATSSSPAPASSSAPATSSAPANSTAPAAPKIDYFDNPPE